MSLKSNLTEHISSTALKRRSTSEFKRLFATYFMDLPLKDQIVFDEYHYNYEDFELVEILGVDRSEVFKYRHKNSGKEMAVKHLRFYFNRYRYDEKRLEKISNEIKILNTLTNAPEIINYYGWTSDFEGVKIFMEPAAISLDAISRSHLIYAINLNENLKNLFNDSVTSFEDRFTSSDAYHFMYASIWYYLIQALKYCKEKMIKHNDLKPQNILLNSAGQIKLCDFGESYFLNDVPIELRGSIAYCSPEKFLGNCSDSEKDDLWSLPETFPTWPPLLVKILT